MQGKTRLYGYAAVTELVDCLNRLSVDDLACKFDRLHSDVGLLRCATNFIL